MNSKRRRIDKSREQRWVMMMKAFLILKSRASKTYLYPLCLGCPGQHRFASLLSRLADWQTGRRCLHTSRIRVKVTTHFFVMDRSSWRVANFKVDR